MRAQRQDEVVPHSCSINNILYRDITSYITHQGINSYRITEKQKDAYIHKR